MYTIREPNKKIRRRITKCSSDISCGKTDIITNTIYKICLKIKKCKQTLSEREYAFKNRAAYYQSVDERLVLNVKNIDLSLNIGQGLAYDVWQQSANSNCFFSGGSLPSPYPNKNGKWDATNPKLDAKKHNFKTFYNLLLETFHRY